MGKALEWRVELLEDENFLKFWPGIAEEMDKIPHTWEDLTKESIETRALNGTIQVWGIGDDVIRMILFTQIAIYPTGKVLEIFWAFGEGKLWEPAAACVDYTINEFAKMQGCKRIDIIGRGGWEKVLAPHGFKKCAIVLSKRVIHQGMQ